MSRNATARVCACARRDFGCKLKMKRLKGKRAGGREGELAGAVDSILPLKSNTGRSGLGELSGKISGLPSGPLRIIFIADDY